MKCVNLFHYIVPFLYRLKKEVQKWNIRVKRVNLQFLLSTSNLLFLSFFCRVLLLHQLIQSTILIIPVKKANLKKLLMITVNSFYESIPAVNLQDQDPATVLNKSSITNGFLKLFQIFQCFCQILSLSRRYAQKKEKLFNI